MSDIIQRWKNGLALTSKAAFGKLAGILGANEIDNRTWDELERLLIQADLGLETTESIMDSLRKVTQSRGVIKADELYGLLRTELREKLIDPPIVEFPHKPSVILMVGVNGCGKTTTAAKLALHFTGEGNRVMLIGADTFRAAAVDQLQIWAERLGLPFVAGQMGSDPGSVVYDGIQSAISRNCDLVIVDTAGRLHTRYNLMEELKKVHRVTGKALPGAPHAVWLVLDATTGQNSLVQARAFKSAVNISGIILAKLDLSARGGMVFAIRDELDIPILFTGLGEKAEDLVPFSPKDFIDGILG